MYFSSRAQAGRMLASQLSIKYKDQPCAVLALDDGGAMVGLQIANELRCAMSLLVTSAITLPRELEPIAGINANGKLTYNPAYTDGELSEMTDEYFGLIEQEKMIGMHNLNKLTGDNAKTDRALLRDKNIIIVSDGMNTGFGLDMAMMYLKPIPTVKLIVATPLAGLKAVDRMHVLADDLYCLNVIENFMTTDHYYDKRDVPEHEVVLSTVSDISKNWL